MWIVMDAISARATLIWELNKAPNSRENGKKSVGAIAKVARPSYQPAREAADPPFALLRASLPRI